MLKFKRVLFLFGALYSLAGFCQTFPSKYIAANNVLWNSSELPKTVANCGAFKGWINNLSGQGSYSVRWSRVSVISDNSHEIIVQYYPPSSGGYSASIYKETAHSCQLLAEWVGGFIFYPVPSSKSSLVTYQKLGLEYFRSEFKFNGNKFRYISGYEMPVELTRFNESTIDFESFFWFLNVGAVTRK